MNEEKDKRWIVRSSGLVFSKWVTEMEKRRKKGSKEGSKKI